MKIFTKEELRKYDGRNGVVYIAYNGKVFDVSDSYHWRTGIHHAMHPCGCDLTEALGEHRPSQYQPSEEIPDSRRTGRQLNRG
jgi:predicted heme/steroid binding protein